MLYNAAPEGLPFGAPHCSLGALWAITIMAALCFLFPVGVGPIRASLMELNLAPDSESDAGAIGRF